MNIKSKVSTSNANKSYEFNEGIGGNGKPVFIIFTMLNKVCVHQEKFNSEGEANSWFKYACN